MNSEAIEFPVASEFFAPVKKLKPSNLQTLKIRVLSQGRQVASVGGILLFGKDRFKDFPDAYLQSGAFAGNDKSRLVDTQEFRDPLPGLIEPALGFINRQLRQGIEIRGTSSRDPKRVYVLTDDGEAYKDASGHLETIPKHGKE